MPIAPMHMTAPRRLARFARRPFVWVCAVGLLAGCSLDGLLNNDELPPDVTDPALTTTPEGALAAYHRTVAQFALAYGGGSDVDVTSHNAAVVAVSGLLADELESVEISRSALDTRVLPEGDAAAAAPDADGVYLRLQRTRGQANQAIGLVRNYSPASQQAVLGHLYALEGYATLLLGETFCSGVPLSTLDFEGDYTLKPGSTTQQILESAIALFDTALATSGDSVAFANLARVGQARALLGLGQFAQAATVAAAVPDGYEYRVGYTLTSTADWTNFARILPTESWRYSVADHEGVNGLDYVSSGDPRTSTTVRGMGATGQPINHPNKYGIDGDSAIVLASWVEARLIQAEAELQAGDASWLGTLNALRESAITPALPDTTDPGDPDARVNLLFRERGFWLFLTGHRQGDLRRLIREYGRAPEQVYPTGSYPAGSALYGNDVTAPIPSAERQSNPKFSGCLNRGA